MNALELKHQAGREISDVSSEIKMLKDRLQNQEEGKIKFMKEISAQMENMNSLVLKSENDLYTRLREQKKQLLDEGFNNKDQLRKIEEMKMEKILGDNEYMKSLMDGLERKVKGEMQKRMSNDYEIKNWVEAQLHNFKDEIVGQFYFRKMIKETCWKIKIILLKRYKKVFLL